MKDIKIVYCDDWVWFIVDGETKLSGHSLDENDILEELGIKFGSAWIDYYGDEGIEWEDYKDWPEEIRAEVEEEIKRNKKE